MHVVGRLTKTKTKSIKIPRCQLYCQCHKMNYFVNTNIRFLTEMRNAASFGNNAAMSAFPTAIFLVGTFALVYRIFHWRTTRLTKTKIWLYRELGFHWTFFYLARIWFLAIKGFRHLLVALNIYAQQAGLDKNVVFNSSFLRGTLFFLLFIFSSIPLIIVLIKTCVKERIPDFLFWVGQDPWLRSEIGLAGHYLDRPPTFSSPKRREYAYRSKRSTSTEANLQQGVIPRNCKSMEEFRCVKSIQELLD